MTLGMSYLKYKQKKIVKNCFSILQGQILHLSIFHFYSPNNWKTDAFCMFLGPKKNVLRIRNLSEFDPP